VPCCTDQVSKIFPLEVLLQDLLKRIWFAVIFSVLSSQRVAQFYVLGGGEAVKNTHENIRLAIVIRMGLLGTLACFLALCKCFVWDENLHRYYFSNTEQ